MLRLGRRLGRRIRRFLLRRFLILILILILLILLLILLILILLPPALLLLHFLLLLLARLVPPVLEDAELPKPSLPPLEVLDRPELALHRARLLPALLPLPVALARGFRPRPGRVRRVLLVAEREVPLEVVPAAPRRLPRAPPAVRPRPRIRIRIVRIVRIVLPLRRLPPLLLGEFFVPPLGARAPRRVPARAPVGSVRVGVRAVAVLGAHSLQPPALGRLQRRRLRRLELLRGSRAVGGLPARLERELAREPIVIVAHRRPVRGGRRRRQGQSRVQSEGTPLNRRRARIDRGVVSIPAAPVRPPLFALGTSGGSGSAFRPPLGLEVPDALAECGSEPAVGGDVFEILVELVQQILVRLAPPRAFRLVRLALADELVHHLLLRLPPPVGRNALVHAVVAALQGERAVVLPFAIIAAAAEVHRRGGVAVEAAEIVGIAPVAAAAARAPASAPRGRVRGPALERGLVDGHTAVCQSERAPGRGVSAARAAAAAAAAVVVVVVVEGEGTLVRAELAEPGAREPPDGALLRGHALVALAEAAVDERVRAPRGVVLPEQRVLALRHPRGARSQGVALLPAHLPPEDVELEPPRARLERGGLLRGRIPGLVREAVLGLGARRGTFLLRHRARRRRGDAPDRARGRVETTAPISPPPPPLGTNNIAAGTGAQCGLSDDEKSRRRAARR